MRTLCIARATLAYVDGLADFAFAMQGLGTGPISGGFLLPPDIYGFTLPATFRDRR